MPAAAGGAGGGRASFIGVFLLSLGITLIVRTVSDCVATACLKSISIHSFNDRFSNLRIRTPGPCLPPPLLPPPPLPLPPRRPHRQRPPLQLQQQHHHPQHQHHHQHQQQPRRPAQHAPRLTQHPEALPAGRPHPGAQPGRAHVAGHLHLPARHGKAPHFGGRT